MSRLEYILLDNANNNAFVAGDNTFLRDYREQRRTGAHGPDRFRMQVFPTRMSAATRCWRFIMRWEMLISKSRVLILAVVLSVLWPGYARAFSFSDNDTYVWPGLEKIAATPKSDTWGIPDLLGGSFNFNGHTLTSITLNYQDNKVGSSWVTQNVWNSVMPMDWFFDFDTHVDGTKGAFDYDLHRNSDGTYTLYYKKDGWGYGTESAYEYNSRKQKFAEYVTSYDSAGDPRTNHPVAATEKSLKNAQALGTVDFSGWASFQDATTLVNGEAPVLTASWDLSKLAGGGWDLDQYDGKTFTYAFALSCANDILFGQSNVPSPEPGTLLLMGLGAAGAALLRGGRKKNEV